MRVLNIQIKHIHGGNPQVCIDYTRSLKQSGNYICVLTNPDDPFIEQHIDIADEVYALKNLEKKGSHNMFAIMRFKKIIKQCNPDIIIAHEGRSAALAKRAVGRNIPVIDVNHGRGSRQSKNMDATIVNSSYQIKRYADDLGKNFPVFYVPNLINMEGSVKPQIARDWNNPPIIGTIGRFVKDKALDVFIDACAILRERGVNFCVKMAGEGEERAALESQIKSLDLQEKVSMSGWVKNPDEFYETIDIFCFPSRKEEFGLVLLEAYKNGLPAVVSDAAGPADIVQHDVDALMVPKENAEALADALQELLENKEKADRLAMTGYEKVVSRYSIEHGANLLQEVLLEVVAMHKKRIAV